jgi:hypothetical protein
MTQGWSHRGGSSVTEVSGRQVSHAPGEVIVFHSMNKVWSNAVGSTVAEVTGWWLSGITALEEEERVQKMTQVWSDTGASTVTEVTGWWLSGITRTGRRGEGSKHDTGLEPHGWFICH